MKTRVKITISIPTELNNLVDAIVSASKDTARPVTKSEFFACAGVEYLHQARKVLKRDFAKDKEEN